MRRMNRFGKRRCRGVAEDTCPGALTPSALTGEPVRAVRPSPAMLIWALALSGVRLRQVAWSRMNTEDPSITLRKLNALRIEHRELDAMIGRLAVDPGNDELELKRLKRRKLQLKDTIAILESRLIPDLDA